MLYVYTATALPGKLQLGVVLAPIPIIDLFAGPGGLSEGFASLRDGKGRRQFAVRLSIEKDPFAHRTLELRALFRAFDVVPDIYYDYVQGLVTRDTLFSSLLIRAEVAKAKHEAWCFTLAPENHKAIRKRVKEALKGETNWVLIGGPPCQAYSLVGRSRMRSTMPRKFQKDERHFLYKEYLRILSEHAPAVFIMENVKGLLSSTISGQRIFEHMVDDLSRPAHGSLRYRIVPLAFDPRDFSGEPTDFVVRAEDYGVPQCRHRVILCGVREDLTRELPRLRRAEGMATVRDAIGDLPKIRSRLSRTQDSHREWLGELNTAVQRLRKTSYTQHSALIQGMARSVDRAYSIREHSGDKLRKAREARPAYLGRWYHDAKLPGVGGHDARRHMASDLHRYLFCATFAVVFGHSPRLRDFPRFLLPNHANAKDPEGLTPFADRFRVQLFERPSTTVVSHIAKDGHYFIHPDPAQCRSLTVREAARLQTFPDNYHFDGNRTQQYAQIGNAVPPLLARQIAACVASVISAGQLKGASAWEDQRIAA